MSESTRKKVIFGLLIVAVIWGYNNLKQEPEKKSSGKRADVSTTTTPVASAPVSTPVVPKLVNIEKKAQEPWGKDPFRVERGTKQATHQSPQAQRWQLSGILFNSQAPVAIINKQQVMQGDVVDNAKVLQINKKSVMLEHNGTKMTITVTKG